MLAKRSGTPGAANDLLKKMRILMIFAIARGLRSDNPTQGVKRYKSGAGYHTWTEHEIRQYEETWPIGTIERTAFALLLYTGQRRSDVVRMTRQDIVNDHISVVPEKTSRTTRKRLHIRLHPNLATTLERWPARHVSILTTKYEKPFSAAGFGNWMADKIAAAGLPDRCVTHGLRKAAARRLAEAGCPPHEIMAITGHTSLKEVQRYTEQVDQRRLGDAAIQRLTVNKESQT
jgi:integrase